MQNGIWCCPHVCRSLTTAWNSLFPIFTLFALPGGKFGRPRGLCPLLISPERLFAIEEVCEGIAKEASATVPLRSSRCRRASLAGCVRSNSAPSFMSQRRALSPRVSAARATRPVPAKTSARKLRGARRRDLAVPARVRARLPPAARALWRTPPRRLARSG